MARPEKYTDDDYLFWIESQIASGRSVKSIKPSELQKSIGGKYSRCQEVLTQAQDKFTEMANESAPSMPVWFRDFVTQMSEQARQTAESQWFKVGKGINESIDDATAAFEDRKANYESQLAEQLDQIRILESASDSQVYKIEDLYRQLSVSVDEISFLKSEKSGLTSELAGVKELKAELASQLSDQKAETNGAKNELQRASETLELRAIQISEANSKLQGAASEIADLKTDRNKLIDSVESKGEENMALKEQIADLNAAAKSALKELSSLHKTSSELKSSISEKDHELVQVRSDRDKLYGQLESTQKQLQAIQNAKKTK
jgi:chromosome segregation ATPase